MYYLKVYTCDAIPGAVKGGKCLSLLLHLLLHLGHLFGVDKLDHVVDTEDRDGSLSSELERLDLGHGGLKHTSLQVVADLAVHEVKTRVDEVAFLRVIFVSLLGSVVENTELSNKISGILSGVHSESLWDDEEGLRELSDSKLLAS